MCCDGRRTAKPMRRQHERRTVEPCGADQAPDQGAIMADKSPRQHMSKKAGKSLKEKRADKVAKAHAKDKIEILPPAKKR